MTTTIQQLEYPALLKVANQLARAGELVGIPLGRLDAGDILSAARRATGLEDWGDERFLPNVDRIVAEVSGAPMTPLARIILRQTFVRAVQNRLWLQDWLRRHPEVLETRVERPIFVVGFPRTGTTVLQNLLALGPGRRGLAFWELVNPVPVADDPEDDRRRRRRSADLMLGAAYRAAPEMAEVHFIDTDTLEECWPLFSNSFAVMNWELQSGLEGFGTYLQQEVDMVHAYREYRTYLQVLLDRGPARQLVLKCPEHLWFVDALLEVFPDACIVWTHRDPYETIASYSSLMSLQWRTLYGHIDRPRIGAFMERRMRVGIDRALAARARHDAKHFFDVPLSETIADPAGVLERAAAHFGFDLAPDHRAAVRTWLSTPRADGRGNHRYDGRDFGLDRERVREGYRHYCERFGV